MCILRNVWELWQRHPQMVCVLVDKMLKTQIVDCSAVATWLFSKEMAPYFTHGYLWELLHLTVDKMNKHVSKLSECYVSTTELRHYSLEYFVSTREYCIQTQWDWCLNSVSFVSQLSEYYVQAQ